MVVVGHGGVQHVANEEKTKAFLEDVLMSFLLCCKKTKTPIIAFTLENILKVNQQILNSLNVG